MNQKNLLNIKHLGNSKLLDQYFGIDYQKIESTISKASANQEGSYAGHGLQVNALNNSYQDFYNILKFVNKNFPHLKSWIDLGCAQGRLGLLIGALFPKYHYTGIDFIKERFLPSKHFVKKNNFKNIHFKNVDLKKAHHKQLKADILFIYLPTGELLHSILKKVFQISKHKQVMIIAIESHGDLINTLNVIPWLKKLNHQLKLGQQRHNNYAHFYLTKPLKNKKLNSNNISHHLNQYLQGNSLGHLDLFIKNSNEMISYKCDHLTPFFNKDGIDLELNKPPHIISLKSANTYFFKKAFSKNKNLNYLLKLRNNKKMICFEYENKFIKGLSISKIIWMPTPSVDLSDGFRYQIEKIKNLTGCPT